MKILAIDTSSNLLSIAVVDNKQKILGEYASELERNSSSCLIPMIKKLLSDLDVPIKRISGFAISIGPGSFTGLRVGVSTVKGLSLALKKPIVAIPTLDVIACNALSEVKNETLICPILDARKNKVYFAIYSVKNNKIKKISKNLLLELPDLLKKLPKNKDIIFLGDGLKLYQKDIQQILGNRAVFYEDSWYPKAETIGCLSIDYFKKKKYADVDKLAPLYLHPRDCNVRQK